MSDETNRKAQEEKYTPHKIVYAIPFLGEGAHADMTERVNSSSWCLFQTSSGGINIKIRTTILPKMRLTEDLVFSKTDAGLLLHNKFPCIFHPDVFDLKDTQEILPLLYKTSEKELEEDEDLPDIRFRTLSIPVNNILILSATPI